MQATSPCINTGSTDTSGLGLSLTDIAGNARFYSGTTIDMGAYEYQGMVNTDPTFTSTPVTTGNVGTAYSCVTATDADGDALIFTGTTLPSWLALTDNGNNTATLNGTPTAGGTYSVLLTVDDGNGGTATQGFDITVPYLPKTYVPDDNFESELEMRGMEME